MDSAVLGNVEAVRDSTPRMMVPAMNDDEGTWVDTGLADEMVDGEMIALTIGEQKVAVYKVAGALFATDNICTHAYALLTDGWLDEAIVECPLHGGRFDVTTGEALGDPVTCNLKRFEVRLGENQQIHVCI